MTSRRLGAEERALWAKVIATVRPLHPQVSETVEHEPKPEPPAAAAPPTAKKAQRPPAPRKALRQGPGATLDGSWDRRLSRGLVQPDLTVDLHGHTLGSAYSLLDHKLEQAVAIGARVLLLVTGKPPEHGRGPVGRGKIRAAVGDWLAASRHSGSIAAVRGASPRHGGAGALYIVLRRKREQTTKI